MLNKEQIKTEFENMCSQYVEDFENGFITYVYYATACCNEMARMNAELDEDGIEYEDEVILENILRDQLNMF